MSYPPMLVMPLMSTVAMAMSSGLLASSCMETLVMPLTSTVAMAMSSEPLESCCMVTLQPMRRHDPGEHLVLHPEGSDRNGARRPH